MEPDTKDLELMESLEFASPKEQLRGWKTLAGKYPSDLIVQMNYASVLLDSGDARAARRVCEQSLTRCGRRREVVAQLALVTHAEGDSKQALELADEALALDYRWPPLLALRASVLSERGETTAAAAEYLAAYLAEPHAWDCLREYCELTGREYRAPDEKPAATLGPLARAWLYRFVDAAAHTPDADGTLPGCEHTFRFIERWCRVAGYDEIATYQYVNAKGAFCDCELIFNVEGNDEMLECLGLLGGTLSQAPKLRKAMLEAEVAVETEAAAAIALPDDDAEHDADEEDAEHDADEEDAEHDADEEDGEAPVLLRRGSVADKLVVVPQSVSGRTWGALAHVVATQADPGATFWAVAIPLSGAKPSARPRWAWVWSDGRGREWQLQGKRLPTEIPESLQQAIASGFEELAAALPEAHE